MIAISHLMRFQKYLSSHDLSILLVYAMVIVAVAGGTGGVGRTVLDAIAKSGEHSAIVLSRTVSSPDYVTSIQSSQNFTFKAAFGIGTTISKRFAVDYDKIEQMKDILQENNVEIVISALLLVDESASNSQLNLIRAAAQSGTVTKFIPSEYYIDFHTPIP